MKKKRIVLATTSRTYWFHKETMYIDDGDVRIIRGPKFRISNMHGEITYKTKEENIEGTLYMFRSTKIYRFEEQKQ